MESTLVLEVVRDRKRGRESLSRKLDWGEGVMPREVEDMEAWARALQGGEIVRHGSQVDFRVK